MDTVAVKFGAASLVLGLLAFAILMVVWGGVGPCTDIRQMVLLIFALAGVLIGCAVLIISLPVVVVRRHKENKVGDSDSVFPKSDKLPSK